MNKTITLVIVLVLISVLSAVSVVGIECDTSLSSLPCVVSSSITLDADLTKSCNGLGGAGCIKMDDEFGAGRVVLDCNGLNLTGDDSASSIGLFIGNNLKNDVVKNCEVSRYNLGLRVQDDNDGLNITNIIVHDNNHNIHSFVSRNVIYDNITSYNSQSHGLYASPVFSTFGVNNTIIRNSRFYNNGLGGNAHGIQFNSDSVHRVWFAQVYNNEFYENSNGAGINDLACGSCKYYNNTFWNNEWSITLSYGTVEGDSDFRSFNNSIFNNTFINNTHSTGREFIIRKNTSQNRIFDNTYSDGTAYYQIRENNTEVDINETSIINSTIQFFDLTSFIYFIYNGRKDFRVENNTITINNMEAPNNDIYNATSGLILATDQSSYTVTIGPGDEIQVGNFIPQSISSITATTTNSSINWIPTYTIASNTSGTYGIAPSYTNLGTFANTTFLVSPILIFSNLNASQTYNFNITEFCDASANCNSTGFLFSFATDANPTAIDEARDDFMATILTLASFMSIFMLVLIIGTILLMIKNKENLNIDFFNGGIQTFIFVVMTILLTLFLIIVFGKSFG